MTDHEILALRAARADALATPELRAERARIQELYADAADASRHAAAHARHYAGMADPRGLDRPASRVAEAEEHARACWAEHDATSALYAQHRAAALRAAGCLDDEGREVEGGPTSDEATAAERLRRERLDTPPAGWGRSDPSTAVTRWRARPEHERLADPRPRAQP